MKVLVVIACVLAAAVAQNSNSWTSNIPQPPQQITDCMSNPQKCGEGQIPSMPGSGSGSGSGSGYPQIPSMPEGYPQVPQMPNMPSVPGLPEGYPQIPGMPSGGSSSASGSSSGSSGSGSASGSASSASS